MESKKKVGGYREGSGRKKEIQDPVVMTLCVERSDRDRFKDRCSDLGVSMSYRIRDWIKRTVSSDVEE